MPWLPLTSSPRPHRANANRARVSEESRCAGQEIDCFKRPRCNGGDLKVSMSISQQGGFAGSLGALCVKNPVFLALPASYTISPECFVQGGFGGGSHFEPGLTS
eukprot:7103182-Prymnesium_polylepis.1